MIALLNIVIAICLFLLGGYFAFYLITSIIINSSEVELLAKIRELKNLQKEYENDYRNA